LWPPEPAWRRCAPISNGCFRPAALTAVRAKTSGWFTDIYYRAEFEALAERVPNFHYLPTLSRADDIWKGLRGHVQAHIAKIVEERAKRLGQSLPAAPVDPATPVAALWFDIYCYICGLNFMVSSVRELLDGYGWHKKQVVFERYD
jgi:CDP-4-dehydro-6-deoxyglucose reductase